MEYALSFDANGKDDLTDTNTYANNWANISCDIWSAENNYSNILTDYSSPTATSLSSGCFSFDSASTSFGNTRQSSIVSPAVSPWSEDLTTPPVISQQSGRWYSSIPVDTSSQALMNEYHHLGNPIEQYNGDEDNRWMLESWQQPPLPLVYPKTPIQYFTSNGNDDGISMLPFNSNIVDPALSRQIFSDQTYSPAYRTSGTYQAVAPSISAWPTPQTIAPKATVQSLLPSSPLTKVEASTPVKTDIFRPLDYGLDSSPLPALSPCVIPSQGCPKDFRNRFEAAAIPIEPLVSRRSYDRNIRRQHHRKALTPMSYGRRKVTEDITCDAIIPQNTFACGFPDCIDKSTGRQKRFKRQEHRKRHEVAVHKGEKKYKCWVPACFKGFTRTDNLKTHVEKTHGKNNPAQRNRYVATLDTTSVFYDPQWKGELTDDGYPLTPELTLHRCWVPECGKSYHLEDKLKTHLLQQHGKTALTPDVPQIAMLDEGSDFFYPDWEGKAKEEGLSE